MPLFKLASCPWIIALKSKTLSFFNSPKLQIKCLIFLYFGYNWKLKQVGGKGAYSLEFSNMWDHLNSSRFLPIFHSLHNLYSNNKYLINANIPPWLSRKLATLYLPPALIDSFIFSTHTRKKTGGKS